jgi:hypothetical protein
MNRTVALLAAFVLTFAAVTGTRADAREIHEVTVKFPSGTTGTTVEGRLSGYDIFDYEVGARAGQRLTAHLESRNRSLYFNVMVPGEPDVAIFVGSIEGERFSDDLASSGDYTLRVYLMRNAARRDEAADFQLKISVASGSDPPSEAINPSE